MPISFKAKASKRLIIQGVCTGCVCVYVCVYIDIIVVYVPDTKHIKQQKVNSMYKGMCVHVCWIHPVLHIFWFSSPPSKRFLLSSLPSVSFPATPAWCFFFFFFPGRNTERERKTEREIEKEEKMGNRADCSWLAALCVLWIAYKCKGNPAILTVWQNEWHHAWSYGWMYVCCSAMKASGRFVSLLLFSSHQLSGFCN